MSVRPTSDDGLVTPLVKSHAKQKYELLHHYATIFGRSMKNKWTHRVYVDLFSGSGKAKLERTGEVVRSSALVALSVPVSFTHHVFCENDPELLGALESRVRTEYPDASCTFLEGDVNQLAGSVKRAIPRFGSGDTLLCLCFADPYRMRDLRFDTIRELSKLYMDFIVLIPTGMEGSRNLEHYYLKDSSSVVEDFTGDRKWRAKWRSAKTRREPLESFLPAVYAESMQNLGFEFGGIDFSHPVMLAEKKRILYRLGFFSRHKTGGDFFKEAMRSATPQTSFLDQLAESNHGDE